MYQNQFVKHTFYKILQPLNQKIDDFTLFLDILGQNKFKIEFSLTFDFKNILGFVDPFVNRNRLLVFDKIQIDLETAKIKFNNFKVSTQIFEYNEQGHKFKSATDNLISVKNTEQIFQLNFETDIDSFDFSKEVTYLINDSVTRNITFNKMSIHLLGYETNLGDYYLRGSVGEFLTNLYEIISKMFTQHIQYYNSLNEIPFIKDKTGDYEYNFVFDFIDEIENKNPDKLFLMEKDKDWIVIKLTEALDDIGDELASNSLTLSGFKQQKNYYYNICKYYKCFCETFFGFELLFTNPQQFVDFNKSRQEIFYAIKIVSDRFKYQQLLNSKENKSC